MPPLPRRLRSRTASSPAASCPADGGPLPLPPPEKEPPSAGYEAAYVYCLVDSTFSRVKFGRHRHDPRGKRRLRSLQTGSPHKLYLLAFTSDPSFPEAAVLRRYYPANPDGGGREWRPLTWTLVKDVCESYVWQWKDGQVLAWVRAAFLRRDLGV